MTALMPTHRHWDHMHIHAGNAYALCSLAVQVNPEDGGGIDWSSEMDRMLVMKMIIKMADINTPTKSFDLHRKWTERITEEFYQQVREGGKEREDERRWRIKGKGWGDSVGKRECKGREGM